MDDGPHGGPPPPGPPVIGSCWLPGPRANVPLVGVAVAIGVSSLLPHAVRAEVSPEKLRCVEAYEQSQRDRREGHLLATRTRLMSCTRPECPAVIRQDCTTWLGEVEQAIPSIVVRASDENGEDIVDARVLIDGREVATTLDGKGYPLDPGPHRIQVEAEGYPPFDRTVVIAEGQKLRVVEAPLGGDVPREDPAPVETRRASPVPAVVLGGVGVVGFAGLTYFGVRARAAERDLDACRPNCTVDAVDATRQKYVLANVGLGVGVLGTSSALGYLLFARPRKVAERPTPQLVVGVGPAGPLATLRATF